MIVYRFNSKFVKLFSLGVQKNYYGNSIEYYDDSISFMFFYYPKFSRVYIMNGIIEKDVIPQVNQKVNIICKFDNRACNRFRIFLNDILRKEKIIFYFPEIFFCQIQVFLEKNKFYKSDLNALYDKYREEYLDGLCNID